MFAILIVLTFDTMASISEGGDRAPAYSVVNREIFYRFDPERNVQAPVVGGEAPLFGRKVSEDEAREWVSFGKKNRARAQLHELPHAARQRRVLRPRPHQIVA